jgi:general secretion pathway protein H
VKKLQTGFTLLELLLVVVIVSVIASLAVLSVGDRRTKQLHNQAQKLEALLNWLADEAVFQQQPLGLKLTEAGYQQLHWDYAKTQWIVTSTNALPAYIELQPQQKKPDLESEEPPKLIADIIFYADADFDDFTIQLTIKDTAISKEIRGEKPKGIHLVKQ